MHTEGEIRVAVRILLERYGTLDTSKIKALLNEVLEFDEEDNLPSTSRSGEVRIMQRIGNIVSHQTCPEHIYPEGFIIDKTVTPAQWCAVQGRSREIIKLPQNELILRQDKSKKYSTKVQYTKVDWDYVNERRNCIGLAGEEFVYQQEKEKIFEFDSDSVSRVIHLSAKQGDGFGYDILSLNENGETIFIEVKTTTSGVNAPFYMSINEKEFFENNRENAFLYRVYDFNVETRHGKINIISANELLRDYNFDPISFMVSHK